jgi:DNA-binding Xre family transcriptional regulator
MDVSLTEIARRTGINRGQLWKVEKGRNITIGTLFDVCYAIDQQPCDMIPEVP